MKNNLKSLLYWYQKAWWYVNVTAQEARKPLIFLNEALLIFTFLTVRGVEISTPMIALLYISIFIAATFIGKFIQDLGIVAFMTNLQNKQNPEIQAIIERLDRIEKKL